MDKQTRNIAGKHWDTWHPSAKLYQVGDQVEIIESDAVGEAEARSWTGYTGKVTKVTKSYLWVKIKTRSGSFAHPVRAKTVLVDYCFAKKV